MSKNMKVRANLRFLAPSVWMAEVEKRWSSPRPLFMTLKWWGPTGYRSQGALRRSLIEAIRPPPDCSAKSEDYTTASQHLQETGKAWRLPFVLQRFIFHSAAAKSWSCLQVCVEILFLFKNCWDMLRVITMWCLPLTSKVSQLLTTFFHPKHNALTGSQSIEFLSNG